MASGSALAVRADIFDSHSDGRRSKGGEVDRLNLGEEARRAGFQQSEHVASDEAAKGVAVEDVLAHEWSTSFGRPTRRY